MNRRLPITDFLREAQDYPVIDVRSPSEFLKGHIPGAINIPLFEDEERVEVGTIYKQKGKEAAVLRGLEIVGPKLVALVKKSKAQADGNKYLLYCWRGGMRSGSFAWLLNTAGMDAATLSGGYKAYRRHVLKSFEKKARIFVLGGETGSGKTEVLNHLKRGGEQVVDLEALAHHKGSAFGAIGEPQQPTPEQFENNLARQWNTLDLSRPVWLEDEAHSIGRVYIPGALWQKMKAAPIFRINIPKEERIKRLVKEYGRVNGQVLTEAIDKIKKRLGGLGAATATEAIQSRNLFLAAEISLSYYDKAYNFNHEKRGWKDVYFIECEKDNPAENALKVMELAKNTVD